MDHTYEYSHEYDDSFAIVSASNIVTTSGAQSTDTDACNQSIIVDNSEKICKDFRVHEWIHLIFSLLNNCAYLTLAGFLMYKYMSDSDHYVISTVILVKFVFSTYFLFHGVFREQPFQIIMQAMTVFSMWTVDLIYTIYSVVQPPDPDRLEFNRTDPEMILFYGRSVSTGLNLLTAAAVSYKYFSLEQAIFKTVGTDMNRVSIFRSLFFGFSLMVFDMEISLSALLLFLRNGFSNIVVHEIAILSAGSLFIVMWIYLGYRAVRTESRTLTWVFYFVSMLQPAYIICLFIRNLKYRDSSEPVLTVSSHVISVIALVAHFGVIASIITIHHFYGRGFGNALVDGVHVSVKNSAEYEELRRILFHPINPVQSYYNPNTTSRTVLVDAEVY